MLPPAIIYYIIECCLLRRRPLPRPMPAPRAAGPRRVTAHGVHTLTLSCTPQASRAARDVPHACQGHAAGHHASRNTVQRTQIVASLASLGAFVPICRWGVLGEPNATGLTAVGPMSRPSKFGPHQRHNARRRGCLGCLRAPSPCPGISTGRAPVHTRMCVCVCMQGLMNVWMETCMHGCMHAPRFVGM